MICDRTQKLNSNKFGMLLFGFCPTYLQLGVTFATFWLMLNDSLRARYNLFENSRPSWFWLSSSSHDKRRVVKCWVVLRHFFQLMPPRRWKNLFWNKEDPKCKNKVLRFRTMLSAQVVRRWCCGRFGDSPEFDSGRLSLLIRLTGFLFTFITWQF